MLESEILEKLRLAGISVPASSSSDSEARDGAKTFICLPEYRGNYGFHTVKGDKFKAIILKGVYKDFYRIISGSLDVSESNLSDIAKALNDSEKTIGAPLSVRLEFCNGIATVITAEIVEKISKSCDKRDYKIPRPLTDVEYAGAAASLTDEDAMLSTGFCETLVGHVLSPFAVSVLNRIPDILNPIFTSCNLKTMSPTIITPLSRVFTNTEAFEKMLKTCGIGTALFDASYAPNIYLKTKKQFTNIHKFYFPVELDEITDLLAEVKRTIPHISTISIVEDSFFDYPVRLAICAEYVFIRLADVAAHLLRYFPDFSSMLKAVFRTRKNSIFYSKEELELPEYLDFAASTEKVVFNLEPLKDTIESHIKKLPFFKRLGASGKIKKFIEDAHKLLDLRDEIYLAACSFLKRSNEVLSSLAEYGLNKGRLREKRDIFCFEHGEVRRISFDTYFGDSDATIFFKWAFMERCAAQVVPGEIYGKDLENLPKITEQMITKSLSLAEFSALPIFCGERSGVATANSSLDDYKGYIFASSFIPIAHFKRYKNAEAIITERTMLFSYLSEYACINDIPLYSGVRFAPLVLDNVKIKTSKDKLSKV